MFISTRRVFLLHRLLHKLRQLHHGAHRAPKTCSCCLKCGVHGPSDAWARRTSRRRPRRRWDPNQRRVHPPTSLRQVRPRSRPRLQLRTPRTHRLCIVRPDRSWDLNQPRVRSPMTFRHLRRLDPVPLAPLHLHVPICNDIPWSRVGTTGFASPTRSTPTLLRRLPRHLRQHPYVPLFVTRPGLQPCRRNSTHSRPMAHGR